MPLSSRDRKSEVLAKGKARILDTGDFLTPEQLAVRFSSQSTFPPSVLEEWMNEHRIFSIEQDGQILYPGYAFSSNGELLLGLKDVLTVLGTTKEGWVLALWFGSSNSYLGGALPRDELSSNPDGVLSAAVNELQGAQHG
ncbi:hypothetical protein [Pseudomonas putida]|uniref:hypothetical protein n=1 Tax=Pseudomonas putida TaxID=303 RepID=UPI0018D77B2F|nr:hypothetical protein [Pseudomonas putida]MBH3471347.1 hypothetical protein [Pseudomonas putida]